MKTYQTPTILWQEINLADILTESSIFKNEGSDNENVLKFAKLMQAQQG